MSVMKNDNEMKNATRPGRTTRLRLAVITLFHRCIRSVNKKSPTVRSLC